MRIGKLTAFLGAVTLAAAPAVAQTAAPLSVAQSVRASAPMSDESDLRGNRSASMVIGITLLVLIIAVALSNGDGPDSP